MKCQQIQKLAEEFPVRQLCASLAVKESSYYAWLKRMPSARAVENKALLVQIKSVWQRFRGIYGAPRIWAELLAGGVKVGLHRVARLMRQAGLQGKMFRRKRPRTTQSDTSHAVAPNLLKRQFNGHARNRVWVSDITYIDTHEGWLYVAAVMDLGSREIVGLAMADHMQCELTLNALDMAIAHQRPAPGLIHHSDRGSQYTAHVYQQRLHTAKMHTSMSRKGNCWDNAPMESFWATLKRECADQPFHSHLQARTTIFGYIMGFYNRTRRHSALAYEAPITYAA